MSEQLHEHVWQRRQNVTTKGYAMSPYEACECGAARPVIDWSAAPDHHTHPDPVVHQRIAEVEQQRDLAEQQATNWSEDCLLMERRAERAEAALRLARQVESDMSERALQAWRSADARRGLSDHAALEVHADALTRWSERFRMAFVGKDYRAEQIGGDQ